MSWKDNFAHGKELVLATASKDNVPNLIVVTSLGFFNEDTLLMADYAMDTTIKNLKKNHDVCILSGYLRMKGKATLQARGRFFDLCQEKSKHPDIQNAILVDIDEVYDLAKGVAMVE